MKILHKFGDEGPKTTLASIAMTCVALSTIRPLITLLNPNEALNQKRYAALRESLTELIAIPILVGLATAFQKRLSPLLFKKDSLEINKEVLRKMCAVSGITAGNLMVPFFATTILGALFKAFPSLTAQNKPQKTKVPITTSSNQNIFTNLEKNLAYSDPKKILLPVSYQAYNTFRPIYRTPSL